jgi:hypothetical protein
MGSYVGFQVSVAAIGASLRPRTHLLSFVPNVLLNQFGLDFTTHQRALPRNGYFRLTLRFVNIRSTARMFCRRRGCCSLS